MSIIEHFTYEATRAQLKAALDNFRPGDMVFLIGPSGAGKTTLRHAVMQEMFGNPMYWGSGLIPAIELVCTLPNNAYYNPRDFAKSFVNELHVPTLRWLFSDNSSLDEVLKHQLELDIQEARKVWNQIRPLRTTEGDYWRTVQDLLRARGCKYASIEQANALLKNRKNTLPADHTLHLLSVAESAGVMFIMTGVTECTELWDVHHELTRRVIPVWFRPYSPKLKEDQIHFLRLLKTLSPNYPLSRPDLLCLIANDLMAATGGLVGHLIRVLENAKIKAKGEGCVHIEKHHIQAAFYSDRDLARVWKGVRDFEVKSSAGDVTKLSAQVESGWLDNPARPEQSAGEQAP